MKIKQILKRVMDLMLLFLLPVLMAEILTGQEVHEWLGVGMAVCFLLHLILNVSWFKNLFKGSYSPVRALQTVVNLLLCGDILALMVSGIMMKRFRVFMAENQRWNDSRKAAPPVRLLLGADYDVRSFGVELDRAPWSREKAAAYSKGQRRSYMDTSVPCPKFVCLWRLCSNFTEAVSIFIFAEPLCSL